MKKVSAERVFGVAHLFDCSEDEALKLIQALNPDPSFYSKLFSSAKTAQNQNYAFSSTLEIEELLSEGAQYGNQ